ncbi:MAG: outer membrane beta-barrel protein [Ignavibacteriales bacterium]|nr:outer membrane beta-barrel protein [Ignavibacteriales bacterium]
MKTKTLLITILLCSNFSQAQIIKNVGVKLGVNSSKLNFTNYQDEIFVDFDELFKERRADINVGIFIHSFDMEYLDLETELSYNKEGSEYPMVVTTVENPDGIDEEVILDNEYDFLKFGINLRPQINLGEQKLFLTAGPSINYLLRDRGQFYFGEKLKKVYWGYNFGIGAQLNSLLSFPLLLEIKYNGYLSKLVDNSRYKMEASSVQFNVGLFIK